MFPEVICKWYLSICGTVIVHWNMHCLLRLSGGTVDTKQLYAELKRAQLDELSRPEGINVSCFQGVSLIYFWPEMYSGLLGTLHCLHSVPIYYGGILCLPPITMLGL